MWARMHMCLKGAAVFLPVAALFLTCSTVAAPVFDPLYAGSYSVTDVGSVPAVPTRYGGLTFKAGDLNTLLIGGAANSGVSAIYSVGVTRDANGHVTGFSGPAVQVSTAAFGSGGIDGGLVYGPNGTLFFTSYPDNHIGQIKPGSVAPDKSIDAGALGIASSVGALAFVPTSFPAAGHLKIASYNGSTWYDTTITPDGTGTYTISAASAPLSIGGGPEGFVFIPAGKTLFPQNSALVTEYGNGRVVAYNLDGNSDPIIASRHTFLDGLGGAEGAAIDPLTGDFLFSTFGGSNSVLVVTGFPEPSLVGVATLGMAALATHRRRHPRRCENKIG